MLFAILSCAPSLGFFLYKNAPVFFNTGAKPIEVTILEHWDGGQPRRSKVILAQLKNLPTRLAGFYQSSSTQTFRGLGRLHRVLVRSFAVRVFWLNHL